MIVLKQVSTGDERTQQRHGSARDVPVSQQKGQPHILQSPTRADPVPIPNEPIVGGLRRNDSVAIEPVLSRTERLRRTLDGPRVELGYGPDPDGDADPGPPPPHAAEPSDHRSSAQSDLSLSFFFSAVRERDRGFSPVGRGPEKAPQASPSAGPEEPTSRAAFPARHLSQRGSFRHQQRRCCRRARVTPPRARCTTTIIIIIDRYYHQYCCTKQSSVAAKSLLCSFVLSFNLLLVPLYFFFLFFGLRLDFFFLLVIFDAVWCIDL